MSPHRETPGSAADWLTRARGDLAIARAPLPAGAFWEDLCFHAQQAAEKGLKAVYVQKGWEFRYTHDLETLIYGLEQNGLEVPMTIAASDMLSRYAWEARYPGLDEAITQDEYREAVRMAECVLAWVQTQLV